MGGESRDLYQHACDMEIQEDPECTGECTMRQPTVAESRKFYSTWENKRGFSAFEKIWTHPMHRLRHEDNHDDVRLEDSTPVKSFFQTKWKCEREGGRFKWKGPDLGNERCVPKKR